MLKYLSFIINYIRNYRYVKCTPFWKKSNRLKYYVQHRVKGQSRWHLIKQNIKVRPYSESMNYNGHFQISKELIELIKYQQVAKVKRWYDDIIDQSTEHIHLLFLYSVIHRMRTYFNTRGGEPMVYVCVCVCVCRHF